MHTLKRKNLTNEPTKEQQPSHINQALQLYGFYHKKKKKRHIGARGACGRKQRYQRFRNAHKTSMLELGLGLGFEQLRAWMHCG
jgi:hypothetical protein